MSKTTNRAEVTSASAGATAGTMRAAVHRRFGGPEVIRVEDIAKPVPRRGELLVRVRASTVSIADHRARSLDLPKGLWFFAPLTLGVVRPRMPVLGMDVAGVVEAVGEGTTDAAGFAPGDEVIAMIGMPYGGHAHFARVPVSRAIARKPAGLSWEEAVALVFGGHTALAFLNHAELGPGVEVLVNGASGAVGTAAVQLAKLRGARVTAVSSTANAELVRSLGADDVIDYRSEDFAATESRPGVRYDVIVDCVGNASFDRVESVLRPGGALLMVVADLRGMLTTRRAARRSGGLVTFSGAPVSSEDLAGLVELAEASRFRPVVDRVFDLDDVAEAHRYVDTGRKRGNVVLRMA